MNINSLGKSFPSFFPTFNNKITNFIPAKFKDLFASMGNRTEEAPKNTPTPQAKAIGKAHSIAMTCFKVFALVTVIGCGVTNVQSAPPSVIINNVVAQEELPFSAQWVKTDLFDFSSTNVSPLTATVTKINGSPIPAGLLVNNIPLGLLGLLPISSNSPGSPTLTLMNKLNNLIVGSELTSSPPLGIDITTPESPFEKLIIPISDTLDIECNQMSNACYFLNLQGQFLGLQPVDFSLGSPIFNTENFVKIIGATRLSLDSSANSGAVLTITSKFNNTDSTTLSTYTVMAFNLTGASHPTLTTQASLAGIPIADNPSNPQIPNTSLLAYNNNVACIFIPSPTTASSFVLAVFNFTNPLQPQSGSIPTSFATQPFQIYKKDNYCILSTYSGFYIYDITNTSNIQNISSFPVPLYSIFSSALSEDNNNLYLLGSNLITQVDISKPVNPYLVANTVTPVNQVSQAYFGSKMATISGNNLYFSDASGFKIATKGDLVQIEGTPPGGSAGSYTFEISAVDANGNPVGVPQQFNFLIKPAVEAIGTVPNQLFVVGVVKQVVMNNLFKHFQGNPVGLSLSPLSDSCTFNSASATLTCDMMDSDVGVHNLTLTGTDAQNAFAEITFQATVAYGPSVLNPIANYIAEVGIPVFINTTNTFLNKDNYQLTPIYSGPSWLKNANQGLAGTPALADIGLSQVDLTVQAPNGLSASSPFEVTVQLVASPQINTAIAAANQNIVIGRGEPLMLKIPKALFQDPQGRTDIQAAYQYSANLPSFLKMDAVSDPENLIVTGTPGWLDVGFFQNNDYGLGFTACRENINTACNTNSSNLTVSGTTLSALIFSILGGVGGAYGIGRYRWKIWNLDPFRCCASFYRIKEERTAEIGKPLHIHLYKDLGIGSKSSGGRCSACTRLFNLIVNKTPNKVRAFVDSSKFSSDCLTACIVTCSNIWSSPDYLSNDSIDILPEAGIKHDRNNNEICADIVTDPGKFKTMTIRVVNNSDGILAQFVLNIVNPLKDVNVTTFNAADLKGGDLEEGKQLARNSYVSPLHINDPNHGQMAVVMSPTAHKLSSSQMSSPMSYGGNSGTIKIELSRNF